MVVGRLVVVIVCGVASMMSSAVAQIVWMASCINCGSD